LINLSTFRKGGAKHQQILFLEICKSKRLQFGSTFSKGGKGGIKKN